MKNIFFLFALSLFVIGENNAQKFGKFSKDILETTFHPTDTAAHAAYIKKNAKVYYDFNHPRRIYMVTDYHYIIKIYDEEGESYADFDIPLYESRNIEEKVSSIKAVAYNVENGKTVETKLSKKDIFREETSENWKSVKFAVPNVKKGTVIEVKYSLSSPYIRTIPKWYFQNYIPTDESIYRLKVPQYFTLTPVPTGTVALKMDKENKNGSKHGEVEFIIAGHNIPAIKEDKYVLNENDYRSGIKYEIMSTQFPNSTIEYYSKDWDEIAKNMMEADHYGDQLKKNFKELKPIIAEAQAMERAEKIKFLYDHVRTNYAWNERYGVGSYDGLKDVIKSKEGSVGDLNLLLLNLLQKSGVPCHGMAMASRGSGLLNTRFPSSSSLNYLVVHIPQGTEYILLDASSKWSPMGELPVRALNVNGILIDKMGARIVDLDYKNNFKIQTVSNYTIDLENSKILGTSQRRRSDYAATSYRIDLEEKKNEDHQESEDEDEDNQEEDIESYDIENTYEVTEAKNIENIYEPISLKYNEELNTNMKTVGDKLFIDATLDFGIKKNPFEEDTREFPIFYNSKIYSESVASIVVPEGYYVEDKPEDLRLSLPNKKGSFHYTTTLKGDKLGIHYKFKINETMILPSDYLALKAMYDILIETNGKKIILSKGEGPAIANTGNN